MIEVTKDQFYEFIEQQEQVEVSVSGISEPPTRLYTRIVNGKRETIGAVTLFETYKKESEGGRYPYVWQPNTYRLMELDNEDTDKRAND